MANAEAEAEDAPKPPNKMMDMLIAGVGIFALVTVSNIVTTIVFPPQVDVQMPEPEPAIPADATPLYHALEPPLIANLSIPSADFLQVSIELMARDPLVIEMVTAHEAAIRNNILLMLSAHAGDDINSREAKEMLRAQVLEEVQEVLEPYVGKMTVEEVYFTSFVAQ